MEASSSDVNALAARPLERRWLSFHQLLVPGVVAFAVKAQRGVESTGRKAVIAITDRVYMRDAVCHTGLERMGEQRAPDTLPAPRRTDAEHRNDTLLISNLVMIEADNL